MPSVAHSKVSHRLDKAIEGNLRAFDSRQHSESFQTQVLCRTDKKKTCVCA